MKNPKNWIKVGSAAAGAGLLALAYNFFNMYSLVGKCPEDIGIEPCQAYDNWAMLNKIGLIVLAIGITLLVIGLLRRRRG